MIDLYTWGTPNGHKASVTLEEMALDGSVPDLAQIPLPGMAVVEVARTGGETRILLTTLQATLPEPVSTIEAGTGDLDTNVFRGTFVHPNAFGGGLAWGSTVVRYEPLRAEVPA